MKTDRIINRCICNDEERTIYTTVTDTVRSFDELSTLRKTIL